MSLIKELYCNISSTVEDTVRVVHTHKLNTYSNKQVTLRGAEQYSTTTIPLYYILMTHSQVELSFPFLAHFPSWTVWLWDGWQRQSEMTKATGLIKIQLTVSFLHYTALYSPSPATSSHKVKMANVLFTESRITINSHHFLVAVVNYLD